MRGELTVTAEEEKDLLEYSLIQKMAKMMKISSAEVQDTHSVCPTVVQCPVDTCCVGHVTCSWLGF